MGWKSVKEHYRIEHLVAVYPEKGICIGSGYVHDIIVISLKSGQVTRRWGSPHRDLIGRYLEEMDADPAKLAELVAQPDTFARSIPVYTYDDAEIIECFCEDLAWPNVTHDGRIMFENTFSADRDQVVKWAAHNARCSVDAWVENRKEAQRRLDEVAQREAEAKRRRDAFELMEAEVLIRESSPS